MDPFSLFTIVSLFVLGAVVGSFLNVCIHRFPAQERVLPAWRGLVYPPSHCPQCKSNIRWHDNVPIFGWLWLRGRCRNCRLPIPLRYPSVELLTALLFVLLYLAEMPLGFDVRQSTLYHPLGPVGSFSPGRVDWPGFEGTTTPLAGPGGWSAGTLIAVRYGFHLVLLVALITASFIDYDLMIIPDAVTRPATIVGLLGNTLLGGVHLVPLWYGAPRGLTFESLYWVFTGDRDGPDWIPRGLWSAMAATAPPDWTVAHPHWHGLAISVAGIAVGAFVVWLVRAVGFWALKREAMGDGDIYLLAMIGSFLGWQATIVVFFLAPLFALLVAVAMLPFNRSREIPYGPYLSLAALATLLAFPHVWPPFENDLFSLGPVLLILLLLMGPALGILLRAARIVLRRLGIDTDDVSYSGEWSSADQLSYLAMEQVDDETQKTWKMDLWPGLPASRGQSQDGMWRDSGPSVDWNRQWMGRNDRQ